MSPEKAAEEFNAAQALRNIEWMKGQIEALADAAPHLGSHAGIVFESIVCGWTAAIEDDRDLAIAYQGDADARIGAVFVQIADDLEAAEAMRGMICRFRDLKSANVRESTEHRERLTGEVSAAAMAHIGQATPPLWVSDVLEGAP